MWRWGRARVLLLGVLALLFAHCGTTSSSDDLPGVDGGEDSTSDTDGGFHASDGGTAEDASPDTEGSSDASGEPGDASDEPSDASDEPNDASSDASDEPSDASSDAAPPGPCDGKPDGTPCNDAGNRYACCGGKCTALDTSANCGGCGLRCNGTCAGIGFRQQGFACTCSNGITCREGTICFIDGFGSCQCSTLPDGGVVGCAPGQECVETSVVVPTRRYCRY